jgi:tRNA-Thr(GGU) m(6)t(6)A37 methyltransferase TsaA
MSLLPNLICQPIGIIHTSMRLKFDAPHQPENSVSSQSIIELYPNQNFEKGLKDLEGFERIWLIWWFHKNPNWRPLIIPPRGTGQRRGVFATRSPHRPNPIGITSVPLISIDGRKIVVGNTDLLDQTPILDIKPYISSIDAFSDQQQGWLSEVQEEFSKPPQYLVTTSNIAKEQIKWLLEEWQIDFISKATTILERAPERSRSNRIRSAREGVFRLSSGGWRVFFTVEALNVCIQRVGPGYSIERLKEPGYEIIPDWKAMLIFGEKWGQE